MAPRIEIDSEQGMLVEWPDGHQSRFSFESLRAACPCAACRDQNQRRDPRIETPPRPPSATRLSRVFPIGRYAVCLVWGDGHNTGIYSWEYLRERCDCFACRLDRREVQG